MQITVTFRHVEPTPALRTHAEEKLGRVIRKYLRRPGDAHVILEVAKERHLAEITLQADHVTMFAKEETHDLYAAIDLAVAKLEHQAQKLKARRRDHKPATTVRAQPTAVTASVFPADAADRGSTPTVVRTQRVPATPMTIEQAVRDLSASRDEFLVFTNAKSQMLAVLYRRHDGDFGLIEPEA
ncbi:MAG: ribosome-associated translation inhibitor RaiA [Candidatus Binatia bacterium]